MGCLQPHPDVPLPKGIYVQCVAKAETGPRAVAALPEPPEFGDDDKPVVTGTITIRVTPKKR